MAYTRKLITLDTVYKRRQHLPSNSGLPAFTVTGGTVNVYHFIKETEAESNPANKTTMVADDANPYAIGAYPIEAMADNILFESASSSPVVKTINVVVVEE